MKIRQHYIQDEKGNKAKVWYSVYDDYVSINGSNYREFSDIDLDGLGEIRYRDDSDSMTDYFCRPSIEIKKSNPFYAIIVKVEEVKKKAYELKKFKLARKREAIMSGGDIIKPYKKGHMRIRAQKEVVKKDGTTWKYYELEKLQRPKKVYVYGQREDGKRYMPMSEGKLSYISQ